MSEEIKILEQAGSFRLLEYGEGFYTVDYSNFNVGYAVLMTKDKRQALAKYREVSQKE